ncbi:unnamed protein product [Caretta caretta]
MPLGWKMSDSLQRNGNRPHVITSLARSVDPLRGHCGTVTHHSSVRQGHYPELHLSHTRLGSKSTSERHLEEAKSRRTRPAGPQLLFGNRETI